VPFGHRLREMGLQCGGAVERSTLSHLAEEGARDCRRLIVRHIAGGREPQRMTERGIAPYRAEGGTVPARADEQRLAGQCVGEKLGGHVALIVDAQNQRAVGIGERFERTPIGQATRILFHDVAQSVLTRDLGEMAPVAVAPAECRSGERDRHVLDEAGPVVPQTRQHAAQQREGMRHHRGAGADVNDARPLARIAGSGTWGTLRGFAQFFRANRERNDGVAVAVEP
jgi:hypothetical protein